MVFAQFQRYEEFPREQEDKKGRHAFADFHVDESIVDDVLKVVLVDKCLWN